MENWNVIYTRSARTRWPPAGRRDFSSCQIRIPWQPGDGSICEPEQHFSLVSA